MTLKTKLNSDRGISLVLLRDL